MKADTKKTLPHTDADAAFNFLKTMRPQGPWVLTAIVPDGDTTTTRSFEASNEDAVRDFIDGHNRDQNIYFTGNLCGRPNKKPSKADMTGAAFLHTDDDPRDGEAPEAAKARILSTYTAHEPPPSIIIDSGNGLQGLWLLDQDYEVSRLARGNLSRADKKQHVEQRVAEIEDRNRALAVALGTTPGTHNIDRLLRLPGTVNYPNKKKLKKGRVVCQARIVEITEARYPLDEFPKMAKKLKKKVAGDRKAGATVDELDDVIRNGCGDRWRGDRSSAVWFVINEMLRRGHLAEAIVQVLLDHANKICEHIYDQAKPQDYAERQVAQAMEKIEFSRNDAGRPHANAGNIQVGMLKLGVTVRYDQFGDRVMIEGLPGFGPVLDDAAANRFWLLLDQTFKFQPKHELLHIVLQDTARLNGFHPVRDYLDALHWDGKPRLDKWLTTYAGAENTKYSRAVGALTLIAAVRRVRNPGCKFDEMLVLEQPQQGTDKSTALTILAVNDDWFADDLPLNVEGKRVIETLRGRWLIEAAELSGMKKADVEHLKAMLSRRIDRARMSYGRLPVQAPRQCIIIGTTNKSEYLRDTSGNRRFWPVLIQKFDLVALRRDRDQLWAEAAAREAKGESIRLAPELWPMAAHEQRQRLADDPFVAVLANHLSAFKNGKIKAVDVWEILNLHGAQLTQEAYVRAAEAMKRIGWRRPNRAGTARFDGKLMAAFVRGGGQREITALRSQYGLSVDYVAEKKEEKRLKSRPTT